MRLPKGVEFTHIKKESHSGTSVPYLRTGRRRTMLAIAVDAWDSAGYKHLCHTSQETTLLQRVSNTATGEPDARAQAPSHPGLSSRRITGAQRKHIAFSWVYMRHEVC